MEGTYREALVPLIAAPVVGLAWLVILRLFEPGTPPSFNFAVPAFAVLFGCMYLPRIIAPGVSHSVLWILVPTYVGICATLLLGFWVVSWRISSGMWIGTV